MDILLMSLASILMIIGIAGCFIPVIPGPPFNFIGILLMHFTSKVSIEINTLFIYAIVTAIVVILDYYLPAYAVKKFGASKIGYYASIAGIIIGIIFFGVIGALIGPFIGALLGELISGKHFRLALKSAFGSFIGIISGIFLKLALSLFFTFKFVLLIIESIK